MKSTDLFFILCVGLCGCSPTPKADNVSAPAESVPEEGGQSTVKDDDSQPNVVQLAVASSDHKTLVAALKAASYVDALSNAGPFTVFAPTDAAFAKLPAGTVEELVKPENKDKLRSILEYHVYVGVIRENMIRSGMNLNQVNGSNVALDKKDGKVTVNGASVMGMVNASNGVIYVIDQVLLPPTQQ